MKHSLHGDYVNVYFTLTFIVVYVGVYSIDWCIS